MANHVTRANATESGPGLFTADASDLRLKPGAWPPQLPTELGNGQPFIYQGLVSSPDGETTRASYHQCNGLLKLVVFND
jgi:hypothetical protein